MILALIYLFVFCIIVYKIAFFKDDFLNLKWLYAIIGIKVLGCVAYYWVYFYYYPGGFKSDSSSTIHDAEIIYKALPNHLTDYLKMIFGFHSESATDPLHDLYFKYIDKWGDSDSMQAFFLNDNRTTIRINAIIMLFSFGHYAVHSLAMLILSFIGQFAFYKTFYGFFPKKEKLLAIIIFLAPSVLFWTSGVLKEPFAVFLVGLMSYSFFKIFIYYQRRTKHILCLAFSLLLFSILKPYILILIIAPLILYALAHYFNIKHIGLFYMSSLLLVYSLTIVVLKYAFHKDVIQTIVVRQNDFVSLSKGGIFFLNDKHYVRIEFSDAKQYYLKDKEKMLYRLKPHTKLMYWDLKHLRDTIFVNDNQDTSNFQLIAKIPPAGSAIHMKRLAYSIESFAELIPLSFFNVLAKPFFIKVNSPTELMASFENLLIFVFIFICFYYYMPLIKNRNILFLCLTIVVSSFLLIGITTTVSGAIVRYKTPFMPYLLMIPLLFLNIETLKIRLSNLIPLSIKKR